MKDIVVGAITNYRWDQIKHWVNSLDRSGFDGLKVMVCYNIDYDVVEELTKRNYTIFAFKKNDGLRRFEYTKENFNICRERFLHFWYFFKTLPKDQFRYIFATDVRDVIFQKNPSDWFQNHVPEEAHLLVSSESIRYKDEPWGRQNLSLSFGNLIYEDMQNNIIYNAGTFAGEFNYMLDLFKNIYFFSSGSPERVPGGGGPDQAALNVLLNMEVYKNVTYFAASESGYAAQLGTSVDQSKQFGLRGLLTEPSPRLIDGIVCTSDGVPFTIVHQYDRIPEWRNLIEAKYE